MKKNTIKAFTLVEMLIVIVIIGILIASLMPRMQTAQGRARDVARKNDLSQIQTAIITSQSDRGKWPGESSGAKINGINISVIKTDLLDAGMSEVPTDPNGSNVVKGLGGASVEGSGGQYMYMIGKRNGVNDAGFILMAHTEVEGSSNWVVCGSGASDGLTKGVIKGNNGEDYSNIKLCRTFEKKTNGCSVNNDNGKCEYAEAGQLRYILLY